MASAAAADNLYNKICNTHNEYTYGHYECIYCRRERVWREWNNLRKHQKCLVVYAVCIKHHLPFRLSGGLSRQDYKKSTYVFAYNTPTYCERCKEEDDERILNDIRFREKEENERISMFRHIMKEPHKHANEQCSNCDKPIDITEWFCYCSLCPDCYISDDRKEFEL